MQQTNKKTLNISFSSKGGVSKSTTMGAMVDYLRRAYPNYASDSSIFSVDWDASAKSLSKHFSKLDSNGTPIIHPTTSILSLDLSKKSDADNLFNNIQFQAQHYVYDLPGGGQKYLAQHMISGFEIVDEYISEGYEVNIFIPVTYSWESLEAILIGHKCFGDKASYHILLNKLGGDITLPMDTFEDVKRKQIVDKKGNNETMKYYVSNIQKHFIYDLPIASSNNLAKWGDLSVDFSDAIETQIDNINYTWTIADRMTIKKLRAKYDSIFESIFN